MYQYWIKYIFYNELNLNSTNWQCSF